MGIEDKRNNVLSVPVNREELKAFNECRSVVESEKETRISNAKFIRDYILLPYLKDNPYITNDEIRHVSTDMAEPNRVMAEPNRVMAEPNKVKQPSKPDSDHKPVVGNYDTLMNMAKPNKVNGK